MIQIINGIHYYVVMNESTEFIATYKDIAEDAKSLNVSEESMISIYKQQETYNSRAKMYEMNK